MNKSRTGLGMLGAALGVLLGTTVWVLIGMLGYISSLAGILMMYLGLKGYALLARGYDNFAVFISVLFSIIAVFLATYLVWGIELYRTINEGGAWNFDLFTQALMMLPGVIKAMELGMGFAKDIGLGILFTSLGAWYWSKSVS